MITGFGEKRLGPSPRKIWYVNQEVIYMSLHLIVIYMSLHLIVYLVCDKVILFD